MRAFKIWNKTRTSSFNLSGLNVITTNVAGLGNKFTNDLYDSRIKKHLISQTNSFEQINLTVNFGVHSNAYQKYREFMNFIQANGRNILVIEYYTPGASRFVDVVLSGSTKSQKTGFGVLVETVTFDRLTPYYILQRRTGTSVLVSNRYLENVVPRLELKNNLYPAGTKIRVKSKNDGMPVLTGKPEISTGIYRLYNNNGITIDYNITNYNFTINGVKTSNFSYILTEFFNSDEYTLSYTYVSGSMSGSLHLGSTPIYSLFIINYSTAQEYKTYKTTTRSLSQNFRLYFDFANSNSFSNYTFKLQLEKAGNNLELDRPIDELNGYTLREVFQNRNIGMPNLSTATDLGGGNYRIYNADGITFDFNKNNGIYTFNGTNTNTSDLEITFIQFPYSGTYTMTYEYISGTYTGQAVSINSHPYSGERFSKTLNETSGTVTATNDFTRIFIYFSQTQRTYNNFQFKLQLEKGDTATPYTVPTNGPYNDLDISTLGLTNEQVNYYGTLYQTLIETPTEYSKPITDTREIELNESVLSNQELIIDSENKTVTLNGANAYQITNKDKSTFLNLPEGDYLVECDTPITVEYKRWVID